MTATPLPGLMSQYPERAEAEKVGASVPLSPEQVQYLRQLTTPDRDGGPDVIQGPDWAVMIGLETSDSFWQSPDGVGPVCLPVADETAEVSARGRHGIRHTRISLVGDRLQVDSTRNSPLDVQELAAVIASAAGSGEALDLSDAWLERDRAQNTASTYGWPRDPERLDEALRHLDEHLADDVAALGESSTDLTAEEITRLADCLVVQLTGFHQQAVADFDEPLEAFTSAVIEQVHHLVAARRAQVPPAEPVSDAGDPGEPATDPGGRSTPADHDARTDSHRVAELLLQRNMERVENDLELLHARLAGTRRVLNQSPEPTQHQGYQRWETGLQRLEVAYLAAARYATRLSSAVEWQQITQVMKHLQGLAQQVRASITRSGDVSFHRWGGRLEQATARSADAIADLALHLSARLSGERAFTQAAVQQLHVAGRDVATLLQSTPAQSSPAAAKPGQDRSRADRVRTQTSGPGSAHGSPTAGHRVGTRPGVSVAQLHRAVGAGLPRPGRHTPPPPPGSRPVVRARAR